VLRYVLGGAVCLLTVVAARTGLQWYWAVVVFCAAVALTLGRRRIFRAGVTRTADEIVCRYIPWYEGNAYFLNVGLPLMGVAMISASYDPGNPADTPTPARPPVDGSSVRDDPSYARR
jgi:hypothetical protein